MTDERNKVRVVLYESTDRIDRIDALAKRKEVSRSDLYRRAMREYLFHHDKPQQEATTQTLTAIYQREIVYDRSTRDYAMYLIYGDGQRELVGFARTYHEAEVTLDQLVFDLISGNYFREAK